MCAFFPCARFLRPTQVRSPPSSTTCRSTSARTATTTCRPWAWQIMAIGPLARRIVDTLTRNRLPTAGCSTRTRKGAFRPSSGALLITGGSPRLRLVTVTAVVACGN